MIDYDVLKSHALTKMFFYNHFDEIFVANLMLKWTESN